MVLLIGYWDLHESSFFDFPLVGMLSLLKAESELPASEGAPVNVSEAGLSAFVVFFEEPFSDLEAVLPALALVEFPFFDLMLV